MKSANRREFERFLMSLPVEIAARDPWDRDFQEQTTLENISGGGAKFSSLQPARYYSGQKIELSIVLPGTGQVQAEMRATGHVVRIEKGTQGRGGVAVEFDTLLHFERRESL